MNWTKIDATVLAVRGTPKAWSLDGAYCFSSNRDCSNCAIYKMTGRHWGEQGFNKCNQPIAVQYLLDHGISLPKRTLYNGHQKTSKWRQENT